MLMIGGAVSLPFRPLPALVLFLSSTTLTPFYREASRAPSRSRGPHQLAPAPENSQHLSLSSRDSRVCTVTATTHSFVARPISTLRTSRSGSRRTRPLHTRPPLKPAPLAPLPPSILTTR